MENLYYVAKGENIITMKISVIEYSEVLHEIRDSSLFTEFPHVF